MFNNIKKYYRVTPQGKVEYSDKYDEARGFIGKTFCHCHENQKVELPPEIHALEKMTQTIRLGWSEVEIQPFLTEKSGYILMATINQILRYLKAKENNHE